jgi:hypothetical protein
MAERNRIQRAQFESIMPEGGIQQFIRDAFEGENDLVNIGAALNVEQAERAIVAAIDAKLDTQLTDHQRAGVEFQVVLAWQGRIAARKAGLAETQARLHAPLMRIA